jgi:hypothetical protein
MEEEGVSEIERIQPKEVKPKLRGRELKGALRQNGLQ